MQDIWQVRGGEAVDVQAIEAERDLKAATEADKAATIADAEARLLLDQRLADLDRARSQRREDLRTVRPFWLHWLRLQRQAADLTSHLLTPAICARYDQMGSPNISQEASNEYTRLKERLGRTREAEEVLAQVKAPTGPADTDATRAAFSVQAWRHVRRFLEQIIPRDIVQADDPLLALEQLGERLVTLHERLSRQERDFRSRADTVSYSIATRIRKAEDHISAINKGLRRVRFGSIQGVRIDVGRVEAMARLLQIMREPSQQDLFNQSQSLEEAMEKLFQSVGGGRVRGDDLLDYRSYIRLSIQVQRMGKESWEVAQSSKLSTGEAIGVGSSILIVILEAWERAAGLLRSSSLNQSLRFLFLDEATRLDADSLSTLIEFCEDMDLQLLLAAPAVGRARRGLTYRLVRTHDERGKPQVVVRGFRGLLPERGAP